MKMNSSQFKSQRTLVQIVCCLLLTALLVTVPGAAFSGGNVQSVKGTDFEVDSTVVAKVFNVSFFPPEKRRLRQITYFRSEGSGGTYIEEHYSNHYEEGNVPITRKIEYFFTDRRGNFWLTGSDVLNDYAEVIAKLDYVPDLLFMPQKIQVGIPQGLAAEVEVELCVDADGNPTNDPIDTCDSVTQTRFHVETRTLLSIEDIEISGELYKNCMKTRQERMSHVLGSDILKIRWKCPGIGGVKDYHMSQTDNNVTEGRLYELKEIIRADDNGE